MDPLLNPDISEKRSTASLPQFDATEGLSSIRGEPESSCAAQDASEELPESLVSSVDCLENQSEESAADEARGNYLARDLEPSRASTDGAGGPPHLPWRGSIGTGSASRVESAVHRVSLAAVAKSRELARAARHELSFGRSSPAAQAEAEALEGGGGAAVQSHSAEVERLRAMTDAVEEDAAEESRVNRETAAMMVERLEEAKRSCEGYAKMFSSMAAAEDGYVKAMEAVSRDATKPLMMSTASAGMQQSGNTAMLELPLVVARAHGRARDALLADAAEFHEFIAKFGEALRQLRSGAQQLSKEVQGARQNLQRALSAHEVACVSADTDGGRARIAQVEQDPWMTEALLARAHSRLRRRLREEREHADAASRRMQELESERSALMSKVSGRCFKHLETAASAVVDRASDLAGAVQAEGSALEATRLMEAAERASATGRELASRQAESLESLTSELFCSPEILRQGPMELWNPSAAEWGEKHFVLTRSGFLHWFDSPEDVSGSDALNLWRCSIEAGEPPIFSLHEGGHGVWFAGGSRPRVVALKAADVDDCCEWVIAIREEISCRSSS
mmetsp:Transcript_19186/g.45774  ORF Transcript_19186/g.45774 Transcript_19186/m.45774 type:complete len:567 (-) Transcript_19186:252-1952(-)